MFTQSLFPGEGDPLSSTKLASVEAEVPDTLKRKSAQIGSLSAQIEICGQINMNCMHQKCISRHDSCQSNDKKSILHKSLFLSQELYHGHCKAVSCSSQSVTLLPSPMKILRQRYQAFTGTTGSENSQGGEQKNTLVFQYSHKACPKWNY